MVNWKRKTFSVVNLWKAFRSNSPPRQETATSSVAAKSPTMVPKKKCLCELLLITLWLCRLFGIAPIAVRHRSRQFFREDGQCEFYMSKFWTFYSMALIFSYDFLFIHSFELGSVHTGKWSEWLTAVNICSYYIFSTILSVAAILKAKTLCTCLNDVSLFLRKGLLCSHAKLILLQASRIGFILIVLQLMLQYAALIFMSWNDNFTSHLSLKDIIDKVVHSVPFMFYYLFSTICAIFVGLFVCFDTTTLQTLNYKEFRAQSQANTSGNGGMLGVNPADEGSSSFNTMKIVRCRGQHMNVLKHPLLKSNVMSDLDHLRRLHESIRESLIAANASFNPQISIHLFIELTVLVIHLYSVILYMNIPDKSPDQFTTCCIDWMFVIVHTIGLLIFLLSCQGIRASQIGIMQQLNDYSSNHLDPVVYAELKLFYMKMVFAPAELIANRFFTLDISLLAPITGSVATYLLVALQFKIHKGDDTPDAAAAGAQE